MKIGFNLENGGLALKRGHLKLGEENSAGNSIEVTNRYLLYNGSPWIPVMGEFQYSRYDRCEWEVEILKMKACGIQVIASYLIWLHHEEEEGCFLFDGDRDVKYFVELCQKHSMFFMARIGPWVHGEVRNGGFPDWILNDGVRTNDSHYLYYVKRLYQAYYEQLKGLLFSDNGPIIGVQIENELVDRPEHLMKLKEIAIEAGLRVPIYTVTAWAVSGVGQFPPYEMLPVFGAYPEAPWRPNIDPFERKPNFLFAPGRNDITIGSDLIRGFTASQTEAVLEDYPYAYCEIGPGVQATYHRRPVIDPYDLYTITMITLAKGNNLPGYYVFHGGRNPKGPLGLYQESKDTGYPNDLPVISYDFQAPIGEYGFIRPSYHYYKLLHLFLKRYGSHLAVCETHYPDIGPRGRKDSFTPRCALRADDSGSGYLFFNTNQRNEELQAIHHVQVGLCNKGAKQLVPMTPLDIPAGISCFFPVNQSVGGSIIVYALAQPVTEVTYEGAQYYFYAAVDGIPVEFLIRGQIENLKVKGTYRSEAEGMLCMDISTGYEPVITYRSEGISVHIIVLKFMDALRLYHHNFHGQDYIFLTAAQMYFEDSAVVLYGEAEEGQYEFYAFPQLKGLPELHRKEKGMFEVYTAPIRECSAKLVLKETENRISSENKYTPYLFAKDLSDTKEYLLYASIKEPGDLDDIKVYLDGEFDVLQIYEGEELTGDCFHTGGLIELGVKRYGDTLLHGKPVRMKIAPYSSEKMVFLEQKILRDRTELGIYQWTPWYKKRLELL